MNFATEKKCTDSDVSICNWLLYFSSFADTHFDVVIKASEIFSAIPMGRFLADIEKAHTKDILKCYIRDFIHMVHPVQSEVECKVISIFLNQAA